MIIKIQLPPLRLTSWFEGCPCHEHILKLLNDIGIGKAQGPARREAAMIKDGVEAGRCNLSSCRGVEAVDGNFEETLEVISEEVSKYSASTLALKEQDGVTRPMSEQEKACVIGHQGIIRLASWSRCEVQMVEECALDCDGACTS